MFHLIVDALVCDLDEASRIGRVVANQIAMKFKNVHSIVVRASFSVSLQRGTSRTLYLMNFRHCVLGSHATRFSFVTLLALAARALLGNIWRVSCPTATR